MRMVIGNISAAVVQRVGNKSLGDGIAFSTELCPMDDVEIHLHKLIDTSFKYDDLKHFDAIDSVEYNLVHRCVSKVFTDNNCLIEQANNLARHLYEQSIHPNVKEGEFYVVYFKECELNGKAMDAIGLFKSESRETILKIFIQEDKLRLSPEQGMSLRKLDKGCIIFNTDRENGYKVAVVDNTNSGSDARYWVDNFLHIANCNDDYHKTLQAVNMCTTFIRQTQKDDDGLTCAKAAKAATILLSSEQSVTLKQVADILCPTDEQKQQFDTFKTQFEETHGTLPNEFTPVSTALKRKPVNRMNTIKLGTDFEVKILNSNAEVEIGCDQSKGMKFFKLYYRHGK